MIPPPWRVDMHRQVDLIEEVGRHYGFEHLPTTFPGVEQAPPPSDPRIARDRRVRTALLGMGFSEAITLAFIEAAAAEPFLDWPTAPVAIANPLSEKFAVMRPSLLPGSSTRSATIAATAGPMSGSSRSARASRRRGETRGAAFAWTGLATPDHWSGARRAVDFSDIKGVVEQLAALASGPADVRARSNAPYLVAGRAASILSNGQPIGVPRPARRRRSAKPATLPAARRGLRRARSISTL